MSGVFLLLTPEQRELFTRVQGLMSLLEGHASYVMNEVSRDHVADVGRMRRALAARRKGSTMQRGVQRAIGLDQKIRQYDRGEGFVREVIARAGMEAFNRVWGEPEHLPSLDEIGAPARWVERVAG
jgi:putative hydrolase